MRANAGLPTSRRTPGPSFFSLSTVPPPSTASSGRESRLLAPGEKSARAPYLPHPGIRSEIMRGRPPLRRSTVGVRWRKKRRAGKKKRREEKRASATPCVRTYVGTSLALEPPRGYVDQATTGPARFWRMIQGRCRRAAHATGRGAKRCVVCTTSPCYGMRGGFVLVLDLGHRGLYRPRVLA